MIIFDGATFAKAKEDSLKVRVNELRQKGIFLKIAAILFEEDAGSQLYTQLKQQAAERAGIGYDVHHFSMKDSVELVTEKVRQLNGDSVVTGIIIQKPWRARWMEVTARPKQEFATWWSSLVSAIDESKDVDGLHPRTLAAIQAGTWKTEGRVLPATVKAVLSILEQQFDELGQFRKAVILGKSEIFGQPMFYELQNRGVQVELLGKAELAQRTSSHIFLKDADLVIAATGQSGIVTGEMLQDGAVVVDVGEPKPDVEFGTVSTRVHFITPVPGGVGPVTVVSLLENATELVKS